MTAGVLGPTGYGTCLIPATTVSALRGYTPLALIPQMIEVRMKTLKWQAFRVLMALSTLTAIALVLEAGRRW